MAGESPPAKECRSRGCHELRAPNHDRCARHAPCARSGVFVPSECKECSECLDKIKELPPDTLQDAPEWLRLKQQFTDAHALTVKHKRPELLWESPTLAALFPGLGKVADTVSTSGSSRAKTATAENPIKAADLGQLTAVLQQLYAHLSIPAPPGRDHWGTDSPKRTREGSTEPEDGQGPEPKRPREENIRQSQEDEFSGPEDPEAVRMESLSKEITTLSTQGWLPAPSNWQIWNQTEGQLMAFEPIEKDGRTSIAPIQNIDLKSMEGPEGPIILWRSKKAEHTDESTNAYPKLKALANSLASMSSLLKKRSDNVPAVELGDIRSSTITMHSTFPSEASGGRFEELVKWWKSKAIYSAAQPPSSKKSSSSQAKLSIRWPQDSEAEKLAKFLSAPKVTKSDFPKDFQPAAKNQDLLAKDHTARQLAFSAWTVSSTLDVLSNMLSTASTAAAEDVKFDSTLLLHLSSQAITGVAALLAPHTQHLVEEAVSKRLELRGSVIPAKLKPLESKLLSAEPFAQKPCGTGEEFQLIVNESQPMQVSLPPQFYASLNKSQSNYQSNFAKNSFGKNTDNRSSKSSNPNFKGNFFRGNGRGRQNYGSGYGQTSRGKPQSKDGTERASDNSSRTDSSSKQKGNYQKFRKPQ